MQKVYVQTCGLTWKLQGVYGAILEKWFRKDVTPPVSVSFFIIFLNTIFFCWSLIFS